MALKREVTKIHQNSKSEINQNSAVALQPSREVQFSVTGQTDRHCHYRVGAILIINYVTVIVILFINLVQILPNNKKKDKGLKKKSIFYLLKAKLFYI